MVDLVKETPVKLTEVATRFGVHRRTVENWFDSGLEHCRMGRLVYTTMEAIQRFSKPRGLPQIDNETRELIIAGQAARERMKVKHNC